jgi:hypothetical protein
MRDRIYLAGETYWTAAKEQYLVKKDFSLFDYVQEAKLNKSADMSITETVVMQLQLDGCI